MNHLRTLFSKWFYKNSDYESIYDERWRYFLKQGDTWTFGKPDEISVGDYLFNKDGNEVQDNISFRGRRKSNFIH